MTYEEPFESFGEKLQSIAAAAYHPAKGMDRRLVPAAAAIGLGQKFPSDGGFLVGPEFDSLVVDRAVSEDILLGRVRVMPVSRRSLTFPRINETSRADGERAGGVSTSWVEEGEAVTATKAKYGNITLEMRKLRTDIRVTDEFLADRPALEVHVLDVLSKEARFIIGDAICNGSGTTKPLGIVNSNALITVTPESGHALGTINAADLKSMMSRCWPASMANAIWVMNIDGFAEIADISFSNGQPVVQYIGNRRFVLGCEVYICEYAGTLGTVGDIFLIDPTQYVLGNRGSQLSLSLHVYFDTGEGLFRFTWRLDGQPLWDAPIAPRGVSYTCSPFIALDTR